MALFATYADLKTSIANWLNRGDLTSRIPEFIRLAEAMFNRDIRWRGMAVEDVVTDGITAQYEDLPADVLELRAIWFATDPVVRPVYRTPAVLEDWIAANPGAQGTPAQYTILGSRIKFDRVPTGAPVLHMESLAQIPALSDSQTSNALLEAHPDIYLNGSLMQAEPFLKNDERLPVWTALYQNAVQALHKADKRSQASPAPLIIQPRRGAFS